MAAHRKNYDEAVRLYQSGLSLAEIAEFYGISRQAVWDILRRRNVEFRPQIRSGRDNTFYRSGVGSKRRKNAHRIVERAVRKGILIPKPCEKCGTNKNVEAHHDDYDKPLDVQWLCRKHHFDYHKTGGIKP